MNNVEKLIAKLIDEHKITGEEAIVLIRAVNQDRSSIIDDVSKNIPYKSWKELMDNRWQHPYQQNSITSNDNITTAY